MSKPATAAASHYLYKQPFIGTKQQGMVSSNAAQHQTPSFTGHRDSTAEQQGQRHLHQHKAEKYHGTTLIYLQENIPEVRCYCDASLMPDSNNYPRKEELGVFIVNTTGPQTLLAFVQAHITVDSVLMAEAAALLLAASIVQQLGFTNATFFTKTTNQWRTSITPQTSPILHIGSIKSLTAGFLKTLEGNQLRVHKIQRSLNTTAHSLAHQAYRSTAAAIGFSCTSTLLHSTSDSFPARDACISVIKVVGI